MGIILNGQQEEAKKLCSKWYNKANDKVFMLAGYAGTGKTTVINTVIEELGLQLHEVLFVAYVGKAALQMCRKGLPGKTIHSAIYDLKYSAKRDAYGSIVTNANGRPVMIPQFVLKETIGDGVKLIILDEASMVNDNIARDLESFNVPIIALGDPGQLPPVFGASAYLKDPDVVLTEIMRQAEDDPIVHLSKLAREGKPIKYGKYGDRCYVIPDNIITDKMLTGSDVVICGRNKTRQSIIEHVRKDIKGIDSLFPEIGEKLICRQNNWGLSIEDNLFLINGMCGFVTDVYKEDYNGKMLPIDFKPDFSEEIFKYVEMDYKHLFSPVGGENKKSFNNKFEFGYAITVHLSQGSEYDNVLFQSERMGNRDFYSKLMYTGITRAAKGLILAKGDEY